jgi:hypothetical protein
MHQKDPSSSCTVGASQLILGLRTQCALLQDRIAPRQDIGTSPTTVTSHGRYQTPFEASYAFHAWLLS